MCFPHFIDPVDTPVQSRRSTSVTTRRHLRRRAISDVGSRSHAIEAIEQTKTKESGQHRLSVTVTDTDGQTAEVSQNPGGGLDMTSSKMLNLRATQDKLKTIQKILSAPQ